MKSPINQQRRQWLKYAAITAVGAATYPTWAQATGKFKAVNQPSANFIPDVEIELTQEVAHVQLLDGQKTRVWKVLGKVLKGPMEAVQNSPDTYLAPTLRLRKGQKVRIFLNNNLPAHSILHWHGLHVPAIMDGNPMFAIGTGETYIYEFELLNRAGMYWYHAHTHNLTAKQVYSGLAGLFIVQDDAEEALDLPVGEFEVPLVIQDRSFDKENQLEYSDHMMQRMQGFLGERILVNG
ncbi:MAG: multicopper oxidase domain-containing protein, partial [Methylicorpusculum sp.]|nr:multicopper oxidase domain-containing protein [Methylicorpusculum sp.]